MLTDKGRSHKLSGRAFRSLVVVLIMVSILPACPAPGRATSCPNGRDCPRAGPATTVIDAHHCTAVWSDFTDLDGYRAVNLSLSGADMVLAPDPLNCTSGPEWRACWEDGDQQYPSVAVNPQDNLIMVWQDRRSGTSSDIYAKIIDPDTGAQLGSEIAVCTAGDDQVRPSVAAGSNDDFVVAWEDYSGGGYSDIHAKVFSSITGAQVGSEIAVCTAPTSQLYPSVAVDSSDELIVAWQDFRNAAGSDDYDIYARVFNSTTGAPACNEIAVSTAQNSQLYPSVATDSKDDFIVAWTDYRSGSSYDIYAKVFGSATGAQVGQEITVTNQYNSQMYPCVAVDSKDNLLAAWQDYRGGSWDVHATVIDTAYGVSLSGDIAVSSAANTQGNPSIAVDSKDRFIVAWQDFRNGAGWDIYAKMFNSTSGRQLGGEINVSQAGNHQQFPAVAVDSDDGFVTAWQDQRGGAGWDIWGCRISHAHLPAGSLETSDFSPPDLYRFADLAAGTELPDSGANAIDLAYSTDSGAAWRPVPANHSLAGVETTGGKLRIRAGLTTTDVGTSPVLCNLTLNYATNRRPTITQFPPDGPAAKNRPLQLAAAAGDMDNDSLSCCWTIVNASGASLANGPGPNATFLSSRSGNYSVRFAVRDGYATVEREVRITVANNPPVAALSAEPSTAKISELVGLDATGSGDPDGDGLEYLFHFGDGSTSGWMGPSASHAYSSSGIYSAFVEARDGEAVSGSGIVKIIIVTPPAPPENEPPVADFVFAQLSRSDPFNFSFTSTSVDLDGTVVSAVWDFGDGTTGIGTVVRHWFTTGWNYSVHLIVSDDDGATNSTSRSVLVVSGANRPPQLMSWEPFVNPAMIAGRDQPFSILVEDPDDPTIIYSWELDGRAITGTTDPTYTYSPDKAGAHILRVTASDGKAAPIVKEWQITVKAENLAASSPPRFQMAIPFIVLVAAAAAYVLWTGKRPPAARRSASGPDAKPPSSGSAERQGPLNHQSHASRGIPAAIATMLLLPALLGLTSPAGTGEPRAPVSWSPSSSGLPTTANYYGVVFGDVNKDGKADVVGASDGSGLRVFLGDGAGSWTAVASQPATSGGYSDVRIGDINNDGNMDIVAGSPGNSAGYPMGIHIFKGNGAGGFTEATTGSGLPASGYWRGIALGDVNGDGNLDIAATSGYGSSFGARVYVGDGTGSFVDNSTGIPGNQDRDSGAVFADFNRDGKLDLAAGGSAGAAVFLGNGGSGGAMSWTASSTGLPGQRFTGVSAADFDNDGAPDILLSSYNAGGGIGLRAFRNVNNGASWTSASTGLPTSGDYLDVSAGDFDQDGNADIVAGGVFGTKGMVAYYGNGAGTWAEGSVGLPSTDEYVGTDVADINKDGSPDILIGSYSSKGLMVFKNMAAPAPVLSLTSPATNVSWSGGSGHTVEWNAAMGYLPYRVNISYSTDGGATYPGGVASGVQQSSAGTGRFAWTVPLVNSTSVRLKLDLVDARGRQVSNASGQDFEIDSAAPSVASTEPANGGNEVPSSTAVRLRFTEGMNRTASQGAVAISGPGGPTLSAPAWSGDEVVFQTWGLLLDSAYVVSVSTAAKDDSNPGNPLAGAYTFSFNTSATPLPIIGLGSPAGGEEWVAGTAHDISWSASGGTGALTVSLLLSTQGMDGPWSQIASELQNDGHFAWILPDTPSSICIVKAVVADSNTPPRASSALSGLFTIKAAPVPVNISITAPGSGDVWTAESVRNITWAASGGAGALEIDIQYSTAGPDGPWSDVAANEANDGLYRWTVPDTPTANASIRVTARDRFSPPNSATDIIDGPFVIKARPVPISIVLAAPHGGEVWVAGSVQNITWTASGGMGALTISLEYSTSGAGGPWFSISGGEVNDGYYMWQVPPAPSSRCFVRATATDGDSPPQNGSDGSNAAFTISPTPVDTQPPTVQVTSPADGAVVGGTVPVKVAGSDDLRIVRLEFFMDGVSVGNLTTTPVSLNWDTTLSSKGHHTITVRAWDAAGNSGNATPVTVTVKNAVSKPAGKESPYEAALWAVAAVAAAAFLGGAVVMRRKRS